MLTLDRSCSWELLWPMSMKRSFGGILRTIFGMTASWSWRRLADEAIRILETSKVQVVFTDISMPGTMDGLRLRIVHPRSVAANKAHCCIWARDTVR